ncbi:PQQ-dependent sugar dehydrogenase [Alkalibacterium sp.]|nr:MAG: PQQ-dependent sugar dehydrogenase [Alkalibacterium sp.]
MKTIFMTGLFLAGLLAGCADTADSPDSGETDTTPVEQEVDEEVQDNQEGEMDEQAEISEEPEIVAENLETPWSIVKHDETFFLTERPGNIVRIENGETTRQEVELEREISTVPEAGLLGFILDQDFSDNNLAYAYYTYEDSNGPFNRIITLQLDNDIWYEESVLLDEIPSGRVHHGGRLKIGPDDLLYAATGDAAVPELAQDTDSLAGKILRLNRDGSIPEDNPEPDSYIYSYGHRNPQGLTWAADGTMYSSEHGSTANDEINLIEAGQNYGWPVIEGEETQEGMQSPLFSSGMEETWAPSGMDYHDGRLFVSGLRGEAVYEFDLDEGDYREVVSEFGRIRDVLIEDGKMYFISSNTDGRGAPTENDDKLFQLSIED